MLDWNLLDLGWLFFIAWGTIVAALTIKAFGPDLLRELAASRRPKAGILK